MKSLVTLLTLTLVLLSAQIKLGAQNWTELTKAEIVGSGGGFSNHDQAYAVCTDSKKNFYLTGYFEGVIVFHGDTLVSRGNRDIFISKYDSNGIFKWCRSAGGASSDYGTAVACDSNGNVIIAGYFYDTAYFGSNSVTAMANSDAYVAKLDSVGNWLWAKSAAGAGFEKANSVCADSLGNIYIAGNYDNNIKFSSITLNSIGFRDVYAAKLNSSGMWLWAKSGGSTSSDDALTIAYSNNGNYLAMGGYVSGNSTFGSVTVNSGGARDFFIAALDTAGNFNWVKSGGGTGSEECRAATVDTAGSIYLSGYFENTITLGSTILTSSNAHDIFVGKISKAGSWQWAQKAGATDNDEAYSILIDGQDCFVGGNFYKNCYFGTTDTLQSLGDRDGFVAKISISGGNWLWARSAKSPSSVDVFALAIDGNRVGAAGSFYETANYGSNSVTSVGGADISFAFITRAGVWDHVFSYAGIIGYVSATSTAVGQDGSRYFAGSFYGQVKFGAATLTSNGASDIFVAKMKVNGAWEWAAYAGGSGDDAANSLAIDKNGNVFVAGYYNSSAGFDSYSISSSGLADAFIAKINSSGAWQWAKSSGSTGSDFANSVKCDNQGNAYLAGYFSTKSYFGNILVNGKGTDDIYVAKISTAGNWIWAKNAGGSGYDQANAIALDSSGHIYVTGSFETTAQFGTHNVTSNGGDDIFIAKMDTSGNWIWANGAGSDSWQEHGNSVAVDSAGSVFFCGNFNGITSFGGEYKISNGLSDAFVSKLDTSGTFKWTNSFGGSDNDEAISLVFDDSRTFFIGGNFTNSINFNGKTINGSGQKDVFLVTAHDSSVFAPDTIQIAGSTNDDILTSIATDLHGKVMVTGYYFQKTTFGANTLYEPYKLWHNSFFAINGYLGTNELWTYADSTGKSSKIIIPKSINPRLGNRALTNGDAVGVFFMRSGAPHCAGYGIYHDSDLTITVWGDDINTLVKDGMDNGETYILKTWDAAFGIENSVNVRFGSGPDNFHDSAVSVVSQFPLIYDTLKIAVKTGWNMISSNVDPQPRLRCDSVLMANKANIVIMKNVEGKNWIPSFNLNTIGNWSLPQAYMVFMTQNDTLKITGLVSKPENIKIPLKIGWNWIAYLRNSPLACQTALANIVSHGSVVIVKNNGGKTYIPDFNLNTIGNLQLGEGYQIFLKKLDTLTYPANGLSKSALIDESTSMPRYLVPEMNSTGNSMSLIATVDFENGAEIGVFDESNVLVGSGLVQNGHASILIWGNNTQTSEKDGANDGDHLKLVIRRTDGSISDLQGFELENINGDNYGTNLVYSPESVYFLNTIDPIGKNDLRVMPNPASDMVTISFKIAKNEPINLFLTDLRGKILINTTEHDAYSGLHSIKMDVSSLPSGIYFIKAEIAGRQIVEKLNIVR